MSYQAAIFIIAGAALGAFFGFRGSCPDDSCALTRTPWSGALWGAVIGAALSMSLGPVRGGELSEEAKAVFVEIGSLAEFEEKALKAEGAAFVYFHADWCIVCKKFSPILNKVAPIKNGQIRFFMVDTDKAPKLTSTLGIESLPTSLIINNGKIEQGFVGVVSEKTLLEALEQAAGPPQDQGS